MRVRKVFVEMEAMMLEVLAQVSSESKTEGKSAISEAATRKDSLLSTGVVWAACDAVMQLKELGLVGVALLKAQEYRVMLEDALAELKEWADETNEEDDEDEEGADGFDGSESDILNFDRPFPKNRPDVKEAVDSSVKQLKLISTLYQALIKRRIKTVHNDPDFGEMPSPFIATRLDHVMDVMKKIPDQTDELASAFYELDLEEARRLMEGICEEGKNSIKLTEINWKSGKDEFSTWAGKWLDAIDRASPRSVNSAEAGNGSIKLTLR